MKGTGRSYVLGFDKRAGGGGVKRVKFVERELKLAA